MWSFLSAASIAGLVATTVFSSSPLALGALTASTPATCSIGDVCNATASCCDASEAYCRSVNSSTYQCDNTPSACAAGLETDVDYGGNDLAYVGGVDLAGCCAQCNANPLCMAFTYASGWSGCYLKTAGTNKTPSTGLVSGVRSAATPAPATCPEVESDFDYYGNDLFSLSNVNLDGCCTACDSTSSCNAFTFVPANANSTVGACYLKSSSAGRTRLVGAKSWGRATPAPTIPIISTCVNSGEFCGGTVGCCDTNTTYCHPWSTTLSQCINKPILCAAGLENDIDYSGNDLAYVGGVDLGGCCDKCNLNPDCKAFTYATAWSGCYLKTAGTSKKVSQGMISGVRSDSTPAPTIPPPTVAPSTQPTPSGPWDSARCGTQKLSVYYHGNDIPESEISFDSVEECCDYCKSDSRCKLFTFFQRGKTGVCTLRTGTEGTQKTSYSGVLNAYVVSGIFT